MGIISTISGKDVVLGKELQGDIFNVNSNNQISVKTVSPANDGIFPAALTSPSDYFATATGDWQPVTPAIIPQEDPAIFLRTNTLLFAVPNEVVTLDEISGPTPISPYVNEYGYVSLVFIRVAGIVFTMSDPPNAEVSDAMIGKIVFFKYLGTWNGFTTVKASGGIDGGDRASLVYQRSATPNLGGFAMVWGGDGWYEWSEFK